MLKRACVVSFTMPVTIHAANIAKSTSMADMRIAAATLPAASRDGVRGALFAHAARPRDRRRRRRSSSSCCCSAVAARRRAAVRRRRRHRRRPRARRRRAPTFVVQLFVLAQAAAAVARAPQADPVVRLHRLRAGAADRRVLPAVRASCCSTTSARTWCRPGCARSSDQARFLAQSAALEIQRGGGRDVAEHPRTRGRRAPRRELPGVSLAVVPVDRRLRRCSAGAASAGDAAGAAVDRAGPVGARRRRRRRCRRGSTATASPACWRIRVPRDRDGRGRGRRASSCARWRFPTRRRPALRRRRRPAGRRRDRAAAATRDRRRDRERRRAARGPTRASRCRARWSSAPTHAGGRGRRRACSAWVDASSTTTTGRPATSGTLIGRRSQLSVGEIYDRISSAAGPASAADFGQGCCWSCCRHRRAVPDHRGRRARRSASRWRKSITGVGARAVHRHRARAAGRLHPQDRRARATISSASWPSRSTR